MLKKYLIPLLLLWGYTSVAQCPTSPIALLSQADIDDFAITYPDCSFIDGSVTISGPDITDLSGLSGISSIGGQLIITDNDLLTTLSGWDEVALLGTSAKISIQNNPLLEELTTFFGVLNEGLELIDLSALNDISGFNGVSSVGKLEINNCDSLTALVGLENAAITTELEIEGNDLLLSIANLNASIGPLSSFRIGNNPALTSFIGLEGLNMTETGFAFIFGNGSVVNFDAFSGWTTTPATLSISTCTLATSLSGLANMSGPVENLNVQLNNTLTDLDGLQGITKVTQLTINSNSNLASLNGLNGMANLASEDCALFITNNPQLNNLSGLNAIAPEAVTNLAVMSNVSLSDCNELFICSVVDLGEAVIVFNNNAAGCDSVDEVLESCGLSVNDLAIAASVVLYPNPTRDTILILIPDSLQLKKVILYNLAGQELMVRTSKVISLSSFASGMYFVKVVTTNGTATKRLIKL